MLRIESSVSPFTAIFGQEHPPLYVPPMFPGEKAQVIIHFFLQHAAALKGHTSEFNPQDQFTRSSCHVEHSAETSTSIIQVLCVSIHTRDEGKSSLGS